MIRKAIIVVLTLAAVGTALCYAISYRKPIHRASKLGSHRHVCIEAVEGFAYLHYFYSDRESFLGTVDQHEHGNRLRPRTGFVTYGEQDPSYVPDAYGPPDPSASAVPQITYAWSQRIGVPMWAVLILFAAYPGIVLYQRYSDRGRLGFDPRVKSTTSRMVVATLVGSISIPLGYYPVSFIGFYLLHGTQAVPMWFAFTVVLVVSSSPGIYAAVWLFWRLTPGNHGGLLWRRRQRLLRNLKRCTRCAYDLTGNVSGVCPECGNSI